MSEHDTFSGLVQSELVMAHFERAHRYLLVVLVGAAQAVALTSTSAFAETYGELRHFGSAGIGHGQFKLTSRTHAFGVDPADNSVYVGDEPKRGEYRIQKLTANGDFIAQTTPFKPPQHDGLEGIAIDSAGKRVYALALERRNETLAIDPNQPAAGTLYAFSTESSGEVLVPAAGTSEGVLTGPSTLESQSDVAEAALIEPKGIAVDPSTQDVIILGEVDRETVEGEEAHPRVALERIHFSGALGERYVDSTGFFGPARTPNSPVVSAGGDVYVAVQQPQNDALTGRPIDELAQIPSNFTSTAPPSPFLQCILMGTFGAEEHPIVEFNANEPARYGGGLSLAPGAHAGEGVIYARAHIFVHAGGSSAFYPGVLAFSEADSSELGWTGGQTKQSGSESCTIGFGGETYPSVAAGLGRTVFTLDPKFAHVVEFGPEGIGCPTAEATAPSATVNGRPLSPTETISTGVPVTFSSTMTQANALGVEWSFGDGTTKTEDTDEYQHTEVKHAFVRGGELTVTETIHTDDFATPTIVTQTQIIISATTPPPTAVLEGPVEVALNGGTLSRLEYLENGGLGLTEAPAGVATLDASASFASEAQGQNRIVAYHWIFGDGGAETTATPIAMHTYKNAGIYRAELTVTDTLGQTSAPTTLVIKVVTGPISTSEKAGGSEQLLPVGTAPTTEQGAPAVGTYAQPSEDHGTPPVPDVAVRHTTLTASPTGAVRLAMSCPAGESSCAGTVTLRTVGAVSARDTGLRDAPKKRKSTAIAVTLASGVFTIAGGQAKTVTLRLTSRARILLAHAHTLRSQAIITAHDPAGATHVTRAIVTLRAPKAARHGSQ